MIVRYALLVCLVVPVFLLAQEPKEVLLWPNGAPGSEGKTGHERVRINATGDHLINNIHKPSITPYIPKKNTSGVAVIIAPGGGHQDLWMDHEGYNPAHWFRDKGIAAFILKYRLARDSNSTYTIEKDELADIQRAIRLVRSRAKEWNIDTAKIGVMGFSAGGEVAALSAMRFDNGNKTGKDVIDRVSSYPDFQALIYPGGTKKFEAVKNAPPLFLAGGFKDVPNIAEGMAEVYLKYKRAGVPAEIHIYSGAGHGFGISEKNKGAVAHWPERFMEWLVEIGLMK
ncbi:MAG: alpha/beta hydrolase [Chitinophagaceae bacterium]|nr:alpha/beta hydrolase [Chitinophagaceae bacterium]